jgi:hypothetical protein
LGLKLRIFNKFADPPAGSRRSRPAAARMRSFNGLPSEMKVHLSVNAVALDIPRRAE